MNDEGRSALAFALEQCASGDAGAFAAIVRSQQRMVFSLAYHCLHDRAVADELAQDVFLELHKNLGVIRSPEHLVFWLRKVTSRRAIDEARRRSRHLSLSLADAPSRPSRTETPTRCFKPTWTAFSPGFRSRPGSP